MQLEDSGIEFMDCHLTITTKIFRISIFFMSKFRYTKAKIDGLKSQRDSDIEKKIQRVSDTEEIREIEQEYEDKYEEEIQATLEDAEGIESVESDTNFSRNAVKPRNENIALLGTNVYRNAESPRLNEVYLDALNGLENAEDAVVINSVLEGTNALRDSEFSFLFDIEGGGTNFLKNSDYPVVVDSEIEGTNVLRSAEEPLLINTEYDGTNAGKNAGNIPVYRVGEETLDDLAEIAQTYQGQKAYEQARKIV
jgi:hypothetical protein